LKLDGVRKFQGNMMLELNGINKFQERRIEIFQLNKISIVRETQMLEINEQEKFRRIR
jgi:hypothetical protein